jgi:hypothetical protein
MTEFVQQQWQLILVAAMWFSGAAALWRVEARVVHYRKLAQDAIRRANTLETEVADRVDANRELVRQLAAYRAETNGAVRPAYAPPLPRLRLLPQTRSETPTRVDSAQ